MSTRVFFGLLFLVFRLISFGQYNLVPNPSFEDLRYIPTHYSYDSSEFAANQWISPDGATPDIFITAFESIVSVPVNYAGKAYCLDGDSYAGIYLGRNYNEYLSIKLKEPLKRDLYYRLVFFYKSASRARYNANKIAILLSDSLPSGDIRKSTGREYIADLRNKYYRNPRIWYHVDAQIKAKGGEQFLTIGNFDPEIQLTQKKKVNPHIQLIHTAYYYIDLVSITSPDHRQELPEMTFPMDSLFTIQKVYFDFDSDDVKTESIPSLLSLVNYLENAKCELEIQGYADETGSASYNLDLSRRRAESIKQFIVEKGVKEGRIQVKAFGEQFSNQEQNPTDRKVVFLLKRPQ